ncbi:hypothetical protein [Halobacillus salinus]|uniref:Uncharacterized protein n=1 Tax=Halobacillus salinus TaxID=192814 RepID=A0A4Z0H3B6_9BACI|nr:hypothetical protein [Halobacillus salinus]TGB04882.1 hypothetical protein E4663_07775 [Halobacillus salinus]
MIFPLIGVSTAVCVIVYSKVKDSKKKYSAPIRLTEVEKSSEKTYERANAKEYVRGGGHMGGF